MRLALLHILMTLILGIMTLKISTGILEQLSILADNNATLIYLLHADEEGRDDTKPGDEQ